MSIKSSQSLSHIQSNDDQDHVDRNIQNLNFNIIQVRRPQDHEKTFQNKEETSEISRNTINIIYIYIAVKQEIQFSPIEISQANSEIQNQGNGALQLVESDRNENIQINSILGYQQNKNQKQKVTFQDKIKPFDKKELKKKQRTLNRLSTALNKYSGKMKLAGKFIEQLRQAIPFKKASFLTSKQQALISDLGGTNKLVKIQSQSQKHINKKKNNKGYIQLIINPQSTFLFTWSIIKLIIILTILFQLSIQICFYLPVLHLIFGSKYLFCSLFKIGLTQNFFLQITLIVFFSCDIFIGFISGFYQDGELIMDRKKVAYRYLKSQFLVDAISIVPLILNCFYLSIYNYDEGLVIRLVNLILFIKIWQINDVFSQVEGKLQLSPSLQIMFRFVSVIFMVFCYAHIIGCLWHVVGSLDIDTNWIEHKQIPYENWQTKYIYSIYWSVMTMSTVGYGDITAQNEYEALFSVFAMLFSSIIFAYCLNTIGMILSEITKTKREIDENMAIMNSYMERKGLDPHLQFRVRKFLQNILTEQSKFRNEDEQKLLKQLNNPLQQEIQINIYGQFIYSIPIFKLHYSNALLVELTNQIEEHRVSSKTQIIETAQVDGFGLYFITSGEANILLDIGQKKYKIGKLKKGDVFGQSSFFYQRPQTYTVQTKTECSFACLSLESYLQTVKQFPLDYEKFKMIQDKIQLHQEKVDLGIKCMGCDKKTHDIDQCPFLHIILNKILLYSKHIHTDQQNRQRFRRKYQKTFKASKNQKFIIQSVTQFVDNNLSLIQSEYESNKSSKKTDQLNYAIEDFKLNNKLNNSNIIQSPATFNSQDSFRIEGESQQTDNNLKTSQVRYLNSSINIPQQLSSSQIQQPNSSRNEKRKSMIPEIYSEKNEKKQSQKQKLLRVSKTGKEKTLHLSPSVRNGPSSALEYNLSVSQNILKDEEEQMVKYHLIKG